MYKKVNKREYLKMPKAYVIMAVAKKDIVP